jgi:hypothetical protein
VTTILATASALVFKYEDLQIVNNLFTMGLGHQSIISLFRIFYDR